MALARGKRVVRGAFGRRGAMILIGTVAALSFASPASAGTTSLTSPAGRQWHRSIRVLPLPGAGCFRASYPTVGWQRVHCAPPPPPHVHNPPSHRSPLQGSSGSLGSFPNVGGNGHGGIYSAEVPKGTITSAIGSIPSVTPGATEEDEGTAEKFGLQLNSNLFSGPPECAGISGCVGWQQFYYTSSENKVRMEYWLIGHQKPKEGNKCPSGWEWTGPAKTKSEEYLEEDCALKSANTSLSGGPLTVSGLTGTTLEARANSGGLDSVVMITGSGSAVATGAPNVLNLDKGWKIAEFGVLGDFNGTEANFSSNTTITVNTGVRSSTLSDAPPLCKITSFTAESNNLTAEGTPALSPQPLPTISSQQTNGTATPASCATYGISPPSVTLMTPPEGATYNYGESVDANYSCTEAAGATLESCLGTVEDGEPINTTTLGSHTFTVTAKDTDGQTTTVTHTYTVNAAPTTLTYTGATSGVFGQPFTLSATLTDTENGAPLAGQSVTLTILGTSVSCTKATNAAGEVICPFAAALFTPGSYTIEASYVGSAVYEGASSTAKFVLNKAQTAIAYTGETTADYHDPFNAQAFLIDAENGQPLSGQPVEIVLGATDKCSPNPTTNVLGEAGCSIDPMQVPGPYTITASYAGNADYLHSSEGVAFTITKEETSTTYTGPTVILEGASGVTLQGQLLEDGVTPIEGRTLTLSLGAQSCTTGPTDASGVASCPLTFTGPLGSEPLVASFAGDAYYLPSSDASKTAIVFAFPSRGAFTLGDKTVAAATPNITTVTWWADTWSALNSLSDGSAPPSGKGFANTVGLPTTTPPAACGSSWATSGGNSPPPTSGVPSYMGTLVTSKVTKTGSTIAGNTLSIVVVKVNAGYAPDPGHHGTGLIVATYC